MCPIMALFWFIIICFLWMGPRFGRADDLPIQREPLQIQRLAEPRSILSLDDSWQFMRQHVDGAEAVSFDDSSWTTVNLPHTWNALDGFDGYYYRGTGWYRKHYTVPAGLAGRKLFIKFDGACFSTELYVNGNYVGQHRGAFAAFVFDLTPYLTVGADNVLAVRMNNELDTNGPPLSGDFNMDGGLYRHINLIATDLLHVSLTDYASPGVYLRQTNVSEASADLRITTKVQNDSSASRQATVVANILDGAGQLVQALTSAVTLDAGAGADVVQSTTVANPHLWNGRSDPYLYLVKVQVIDSSSGAVVDQVKQPLGFRYYRVDPSQGFFLNGQYLDLHGVSFHQDRAGKGWAISDEDQAEDVSLILEIGATFVRLSHYQHPPKTYELLDASGLVAWSEIPLIDNVTDNSAFLDNAKQQLVEMIRQNYNHPAILFWGMFNEIPDNATTQQMVSELVQLAHQEDPTRPTTAASNLGNDATVNYIPDMVGFNQYFGWYYGALSDLGPWADGIHADYPNQAIGLSEFGAGASIDQHQDPPVPIVGGEWHPEEYQDLFHEASWQQLQTRPFIWCKSVWNMFDFATYLSNVGDTPGINDKGLITRDRQTRKDAFYWYKANWTSEPVLYITSRRYVDRPSDTVNVKVYSNLDAVQLSVNGTVLGTQTSSNRIFLWAGVQLASGANTIAVTATKDGGSYADEVTWNAP
jgi:beta-galactosidase